MNAREVMQTLKKLGTAQNVKIYKRHGAGDNVFGVSFANLNKLKKQIKSDHELAEQLWKTGNVDAMSLATMVADPARFTASSADAWLKDISYSLLGDLFGGLIGKSELALSKYKKWSKSKKEFVRLTGYSVLCTLLRDRPDDVPDDVCQQCLKIIEQQIHASPNLARQAMNMALIAIGIYKPSFRKQSISTAERIGKVEVDHGQTSCKTPDAVSYIRKGAAHQAKKKKRRPKTRVC